MDEEEGYANVSWVKSREGCWENTGPGGRWGLGGGGQVLVKKEKKEKESEIDKRAPIESLHMLPTLPLSLSSSVFLHGWRNWEIRAVS